MAWILSLPGTKCTVAIRGIGTIRQREMNGIAILRRDEGEIPGTGTKYSDQHR